MEMINSKSRETFLRPSPFSPENERQQLERALLSSQASAPPSPPTHSHSTSPVHSSQTVHQRSMGSNELPFENNESDNATELNFVPTAVPIIDDSFEENAVLAMAVGTPLSNSTAMASLTNNDEMSRSLHKHYTDYASCLISEQAGYSIN